MRELLLPHGHRVHAVWGWRAVLAGSASTASAAVPTCLISSTVPPALLSPPALASSPVVALPFAPTLVVVTNATLATPTLADATLTAAASPAVAKSAMVAA